MQIRLLPLALLLATTTVFATGAPVVYQLPADGRTYRVTLAIVDAKNPDWIISQFACGVPRTSTPENGGRLTENWDGLDDNFMPVPPGEYAVRGIYMPAQKWRVDGDWHSVTPKFIGGAAAWEPPTEQWDKREPFGGDPCNQPLGDVAIGPNGVAVFYYVYLENGLNCPMIDLKKPLGYDQFLGAFRSGGAAGGPCAATDGETVWAFSTDGGPKFVYRADGKPFGKSPGANRSNCYLPDGWVTAMAASKPYVAVAQRGKIVQEKKGKHNSYFESTTEFVDKITIHDGADGNIVATLPRARPQGLAARNGLLYALQADGTVSVAKLPDGAWQRVFSAPANIHPAALALDSHDRFYVSDSAANKVFQLDRTGKILRTYGRLDAQEPGTYDRETFIAPGKLATWTDDAGNDRLIVVEHGGPNRASEWSADGKLLREFLSLQTKANNGYAVDPEHPEHIYIPGQQNWLTRFRVDYEHGTWTVDVVWPDVGNLVKPQLIRANGHTYLAGARSYNAYELDGDRWKLCLEMPREPGIRTYHGANWLDDFSLLAVRQGTPEVWRFANGEFKKVLTDPVFVARAEGHADAVHGGNELAEKFSSDWAQADGSLADGFYVQARGGKNFSANEGAQHKISRYVPDGAGGYRLKWRTGRTALHGVAEEGEMYGGMRIRRPINGLLSVVDQSRCGILLYTDDGLYVDTIFPDARRVSRQEAGIYPQGGEFFCGIIYPNRDNGKIYFGMGKYTPLLFEAEGWSLKENPVRPLTTLPKTVTITAAQIASPPEIALSLRGGAGMAKLARFAPALGSVALDGSLNGWESCEPVKFQADKEQTVEVRCLYRPDQLYLRRHARLGRKCEPRPLPALERVFTHDQLADTLSFYVGDARVVFGVFDNKPVAVGFYSEWAGAGQPQVYRTPVGQTKFAHVGPVSGAQLGHAIDADGNGFVLVAMIPRAAIPKLTEPFTSAFRTLVNFEATFAGHNKFWWANSDGSASRETYDEPTEARLYPGSWAPAQFAGLEGGVTIRSWLICGPFGGPGAEKFKCDPQGSIKDAVRKFCEAATYPPDDGKVDLAAKFTGEMIRGFWPALKEVRWKPATIADLDTRVVLGCGGQVWYGATWVYANAETPVEFQFQSHAQTTLRWFLNGEAVTGLKFPNERRSVTAKTLTLRTGWNQIMFRGYCVGYPPFRAGLVLNAPVETLWQLQLADAPQ